MAMNPQSQYATDRNLASRQRLWSTSRRVPEFDLFAWVLDLAGIGQLGRAGRVGREVLHHHPAVGEARRRIRLQGAIQLTVAGQLHDDTGQARHSPAA